VGALQSELLAQGVYLRAGAPGVGQGAMLSATAEAGA
jgi:hypothetical protein